MNTNEKVAITGNTYPVKDQLKALGGRWNPDRAAWMVPIDKAEEAKKLVESVPEDDGLKRKAKRFTGSRRSFYRCPQCGNKADGGPGAPGYMCGEPCGS